MEDNGEMEDKWTLIVLSPLCFKALESLIFLYNGEMEENIIKKYFIKKNGISISIAYIIRKNCFPFFSPFLHYDHFTASECGKIDGDEVH